MNKKYNKELIVSIIIPIAVGLISALLSINGFINFNELDLPSISPPGFIFPVVWTIFYILMGISSYYIYDSNNYYRSCCLLVYGLNLFINFLWSPIFFGLGLRLFSLIWVILLVLIVAYMIWCFYNINKKAAYLNIPYLLWCLFAVYLNYLIYIMNR